MYQKYLYNLLLRLRWARLWGDWERDLERLHEPEREEEYEYLLLRGGERDTEGEDREEERDEELELLSEWRGRYLEGGKKEEFKRGSREIITSINGNQNTTQTLNVLTEGLTFS